jgi:hypothetical protein
MALPLIGALIVRLAAGYAIRRAGMQLAKRQLKKKIDDAIRKANQKLRKEAEERAKRCPDCKPLKDPCRSLKKGDPDGNGDYRGGSHNGTRGRGAEGIESNHMPSADASRGAGGPSRANGPAIQMDRADHQRTQSHGNSREARDYRAQQSEHIRNGNLEEAFSMDVANILDLAGQGVDVSKYMDAIAEAAAYLACLKKHKLA